MANRRGLQEVAAENQELRARLEKAEESLREILSGEADALYVAGTDGTQLFALKDANHSYRTLIENMSEGALTLTPAGLILYANQRFAEMLGAPLEKVIGSEIHTWFPRERQQSLQTLLRNDAVHDRGEESALAGAGGTRVPVYLSVSRLVLNESDSICMVVTDLTEQKRHAAILAAEGVSLAILEQAGDAIVICDQAGRIIRASKQAHMLCGKNPAGEYFELAFPLRDLDGTALSSISAIETSDRQSIEATLERDGLRVELLVSAGQKKGTQDELIGSVVTLTDITARKRGERELLLFRSAINAAADGIFIVSRSSMRFIDVNAAACKMLGFTRGELLQIGPRELAAATPEDVERMHDAVIAGHGTDVLTETLLRRKDGSQLQVELRRHAIRSGTEWIVVGVVRDITKRKMDELRLLESERRFSELLDNVELLSVMMDREARITYCNDYLYRLTGWQKAEVVGRNWIELFSPPETAGQKKEIFSNLLLDNPGAGHHESEILTRSGKRRLVRWNNSLLRSVSGEVVGTASVGEDITEQRGAEQSLLELQRKSEMILDSIGEGIIGSDMEGNVTFNNPAAGKALGYGDEELLGKQSHASFHYARKGGAIYPIADCPMQLTLLDGVVRTVDDDVFWRKDGSGIPVEYTTAPLRDDQSGISGVVVAFRDVTERKKVEARVIYLNRVHAMQSAFNTLIVRVRDGDELLREACRVAVDVGGFRMSMIGVVNRDGMSVCPVASMGKDETLLNAIRSVLSSVDLASDTMVARAIRESRVIVSNASKSDPQVVLRNAYAEADVNSIVVLPLILAGEVFGVLALYACESNFFHDEELKLLSELTGDISFAMEYLKAQEALRSLNEELENKVAVRTADLELARLEAERANAAKNIFLATMSHEIRTPMNGVIGMIDVLLQSSLSGPQIEMSNIIRDSAYALLAVISDILDFSKIEAGKLEIDSAPMCVSEVVEKTCEIMDRMAQKNGVELTLFTDPAIPVEVVGDPGRLRQILINLANNAIKFSCGKGRSGRVSVRALLADRTPEHVMLEFDVADNGVGMDEGTRARLFSPFVQADVSTTRNFGGTGLGLAISRQLANMMDGDIAVHSELGEGALFRLHIPFAVPTGQRTPGRSSSLRNECGPDPGLVAGLSCLVFVTPDGIGGDLATYLEYGDAVVERISDLRTARCWIASRPAGRAVVVIDRWGAGSTLDELMAAASAFPESDIHFVALGRGSRGKPRVEGDNLVSVDANALTRRTLLHAVAIAAGRVQVQEPEGRSDESSAPLRQLSGDTIRRRGSRILVAEDNAINKSVIQLQLALLGYVADVAEDGREALALWHQGDHALLLTDLQMPNMDGYELTGAIRRGESDDRHMPIVALTANALKSEEQRCKAAGMDDYLTKPVLLDRLQDMLEKWLPIPGEGEVADDRVVALPASTHFAVLDRAALPKQLGDDPETIAQLFKVYQRSAQKTAGEIRAAIALGDWKAAGDGGHKLKSSSRAVGALALGEICHQLEQAGMDGHGEAAVALAAELEKALAAVLAAIDHEEN